MAYLRDEKETVEMDFPLSVVWTTIKDAVARLGWTLESSDDLSHRLQAKTKKAFLSYSTLLTVDAIGISEKVTRVVVSAETPVTTITSVVDFGKTHERIDTLLQALSIELNTQKKAK